MNEMISEIIEQELGDDSSTKNSNNKKTIFGGLTMETFFTLAHTLRAMAECIKYLLDVKKLHACYQAN